MGLFKKQTAGPPGPSDGEAWMKATVKAHHREWGMGGARHAVPDQDFMYRRMIEDLEAVERDPRTDPRLLTTLKNLRENPPSSW